MRPRGHILDRGNGVFDLMLSLGIDERTGKRKRKSIRFRGSKKAAQKELVRLLAEIDDGGYIEPSEETLGGYLKQWLDGYRLGVSAKTHENAAYAVRYVTPHLGKRTLDTLTAVHIRGMYATMLKSGKLKGEGGLSPQSVAFIHRVLKAALQQAVEDGLLRTNPAAKVQPPKDEEEADRMRVLDEEQTRQLVLAARGTPLFVPIIIAATTGLRRGEVLGLRWQDLDLEAGTLTVAQACGDVGNVRKLQAPKTRRSRRTIKLHAQTVEALREWRREQLKRRQTLADRYEDHGLVVCRQNGTPYAPAGFSTWFRLFLKQAGLRKIRFHDLRHSHLSQLLDQGAQLTEVSARAGHANPAITLRIYAQRIKGAEERMLKEYEERLDLTGTEERME